MANSMKRLYQELGAKLKERLSEGFYGIGDKLPPEREISEYFGVSRTVVREALIMLEVEGLIDIRKGSGIYVIGLPQSVNQSKQCDDNHVGPFELLQARQLLESAIAGFAATQVVKSDIEKMRKVLQEEKRLLNQDKPDLDLDAEFHYLVGKATQNSILAQTIKNMWDRRKDDPVWIDLNAEVDHPLYRQKWLQEHEQILQALQKKDAKEARQAMWQHIESAKQRILKKFDCEDPEFDGYLFDSIPSEIAE